MPAIYKGRKKMRKLAIYDLDGTVINSLHRYRTLENNKIDLQYWHDNCTDEKIAMDTLLPLADTYKRDLEDSNTMVAIATARTMQVGDANYKYISENLGIPHYIFHRKQGDERKGVILKTTEILNNIKRLSEFDNIRIYEDNKEYLDGMKEILGFVNTNIEAIFVPSEQGH